jgi:membrane dipeptidase
MRMQYEDKPVKTTSHIPAALLLLFVVLGVSCSSTREGTMTTDTPHDAAIRLAQRLLIADTHLDTPEQLLERPADITERTYFTCFDYPRAVEGGLDCAFFAVFVSHSYETQGGAKDRAEAIITLIEDLIRRRSDRFALVRSPDEVAEAHGQGKVGIALGIENGAPLEGDLQNIRHFFDRGVRYITLAHFHPNHIADASWDPQRRWNGLSPFGRTVVAEMNRVGMMIDISHLSDSAAFEVLRLTRAPVIATHSSCRYFTPGYERNISDDLIRAVAANGGVVDINFGSMFLVDSLRAVNRTLTDEIDAYFKEHNLKSTDDEAVRFAEQHRKNRGIPYADVHDVAKHIDHVIRLAGIDHVGLGSDFDGLGDDLPTGLKDVSGYPNLIAELLTMGYDEAHIEKICSGNVFRVWREAERIGRELQGAR